MTKYGLFSGEVQNTFTVEDMVSMYKIGWRSLEGATLHPRQWATNEELEDIALAHVETLVRMKAGEITGIKWEPKSDTVILSIVPPEAPANEN
jgi:hypothetical protein